VSWYNALWPSGVGPTEEENEFQGRKREASREYWKKHPPTFADPIKPKAIGGKDYGYTGKYNAIIDMIANHPTGPFSGRSTGAGYLSKQQLLSGLTADKYFDKRLDSGGLIAELLTRVKKAPHKYYTSTEAG